jgi:excinuclease ABC subunit C
MGENDEQFFSQLPASPAVFLLRPHAAGGEPYVSKTANLRRRLERLLGAPQSSAQSRRLNLRERLHLRPAPLLHLLHENAYPRLTVTSRIRSLSSGNSYFGPFASRAEAEQYASDSLDFFLLRRCTPELDPDPSFPGCVYSEMKMCLAPCFRGCTDERYAEEVERVQHYLESQGRGLLVEIGRARDEASARLEFEAAAAAHARLEKLQAVRSRVSEIVHRIDRLNGVLLQPSHLPGHIALFRIAGGMLSGPIPFDVSSRTPRQPAEPARESGAPRTGAPHLPQSADVGSSIQPRPTPPQSAQSQSMEARIQQVLRGAEPAPPASAQQWMEHLAILKRWYYRTSKVGEIFFEDEHGALPMRRLVRAVGRVLRGEKPAGDLSETAGDYWIYRDKEAGLR